LNSPVSEFGNERSDADVVHGVGVLVLQDGKIFAGHRRESGEICGTGGHIEYGETPAQAAIRETLEEFGITPTNLKRLCQLE